MKPSNKKVTSSDIVGLFKKSKRKASSELKPLRRRVDKKTENLEAPDAIVINNLMDLKEIVEHLKPDNQSPDALPITVKSRGTLFADDNFAGNITIPQTSGQSMTRRTLLEGFEMLKRRQQTLDSLEVDEDAYGGFPPAPLSDPNEQVTWVDRFIMNRLGGVREGLFIVWEISEGKYRLDPWSCVLEKIDD